MNKNLYRLIFNKARGMLMAVPEIARSCRAGSSPSSGTGHTLSQLIGKVNGLSFALLLALGAVQPVQAAIVADGGAPGNQQPTVVGSANGTPQVNIQTPSAGGVSRNVYSQFDVNNKGVVLNNSRASSQTQLAGMVSGNPWLAKGEAKVILNEVNSRNPSQLNGFIEVAGQKAQVVIANPAGITCSGCGFINANRATLTTGQVKMNNGQLSGYDVDRGEIIIQGNGMDSSLQDHTDLIARSVKINAGLWAKDLAVTTGRNSVDAANQNATRKADDGSAHPQVAIDVAALGGMYANKIRLLGTEAGVGVHNAGAIGASAGDVVVNADGTLSNSGAISATQAVQLTTRADLNNSGTIYAGRDTTLRAGAAVSNSGIIAAQQHTTVSAASIHSSAKGTLAAGMNRDGTFGTQGGNLTLNSQGILSANGQNAAAGQLTVTASAVDLSASQTSADGITLSAGTGDISTAGANVSASHQLSARTAGRLNNDGGKISADKLDLTANRLSNQKGNLQQRGLQDLTLSLAGGIDNRGGILGSNSNTLTLNTATFDNQQGQLLARGKLTATSSALNNAGGTVQSGQSLLWNTQGNAFDNQRGTFSALGSLTLNAGDINNQQGLLAAGESLSVFSAGLDNSNAGNISSKGALAVTSADLNNRAGQIQALGDITLTAASASIDNTGGLIQGAQAVTLSAADIVNSQTRRDGAGIQGSSLSLRAQNLDNRDGALLADNDLSLFLSGTLDNGSGLVSAQGNLQAQAQQIANRSGNLEAGNTLSLRADGLSGDGTLLSLGDMTLDLTQDFNNSGRVQASRDLNLTTQGDLNNQALMQAGNLLAVTASNMQNGADAEMGGSTTQLTAAQTLNNRGLIDGFNTRILAAVLNNIGSGRLYGDALAIAAATLNNLAENGRAATVAARQRLDLAVEMLNNRDHALIYSDGDMALGRTLDADWHASGQASVLNNHSATLESGGNMALNVAQLNNVNDHFALENVLVSQEHISEYEVARLNNGVRYNDKDYTIYIYQDEVNTLCIEGVICHTTDGDRFTHYDYVRTITEDRVKESDPGKIIAGGSLSVSADRVLNDKSQIVAGGDLNLQGSTLDNVEVAANRQISDAGTATFYSRHQQKHGDSSNVDVTGYTPPTVIQGIALNASTAQDHARGEGSGLTIGGRDAAAITPATVPAGKTFEVTIGSGDVVRLVGPDIRVPDNSLYRVQPASTSPYLIETDPRFTNKKQWLSSDYMMNAFTTDPNNVLKRLGDGYYEQRLIREQVIALSGGRYLGGFQNDEEQYKGLMDGGVAFGKKYQLTPGVALTAQQMALLTGDIVWMVAQTVTLPDGSSQRVLVPQVYATLKTGDLDGSGALLAGNSVGLNLSGDLNNGGRISAQQRTQLLAQNINNHGGLIRGGDVALQARNDINNTGGTIAGDHSLLALAGRDISATTTTRSAESADGNFARSTVDRVAGLYVQQPDGRLALQAGRDVSLSAAQVVNSGENGSTAIRAGRDLNLATVDTGSKNNLSWGDNWQHHGSSQQVGSTVTGAGSVALAAGRDVDITAGTVNAGQQLSVAAGNDIRVQHGTDGTTLDQHYQATGSSGMLSKTRTESRDTVSQQTVNGSQLGGDGVRMQAGHDLTVTGSSVAGAQDVALSAGNSLTLDAAAERRDESHMLHEKKSGLSGTGGVGVTAGSSSTRTTDVAHALSSVGSTVGSTGGSVTLNAGNSLTVKGADVLAAKDIALTGKEVNILAAENQSSQRHVVEQKQSGLTLALSGTVGSAVNSAVSAANDASKESSGRLAALQGMKAALTGVQAAQAASLADAGGATGSMAGVNLSYGSQSSRSEQTSTQTQSQGSSLTAGNNLTVNATGTDINVQGSRLQAGKDISLGAARDVNLVSAQNTQRLDGKNESHGGSVGVGISVGQGANGPSLNASVNRGRGSETGSGTTHSETTLNAGNALSITSGRDATLTGAQASGEAVKISVGRDLTLISQQDEDDYDAKQQSASAGGSVSSGGGSSSVNLSRDKMHSSWRSVEEQTGIFAGKGGFDVTVGGHTQLNGAVMGSTADASQNKLDTGTLGFSDIRNQADYQVEHQSVGVSSGGSIGGQFAGNMANGLLTGVNGKGSDSSTTKSAVSDGTIIVRDQAAQKQDVGDLSRDVEHANQTLSPIFDKEKEQNRLKEAQLIGEIGSQAADIARTQGQIVATKAANEKMKNVTPQQLEAAKKAWMAANPGKTPSADDISAQAYTTLYNQAFTDSGFGTGGKVQQAIQAATAAVQGLAGGDLTKAIAGGSAPYIANIIGSSGMDDAGKVLAHAAVNAALAAAQGNNALVGAAGAATAEISGMIALEVYGKHAGELNEEQKQTVSALGTLAAGLAGGLAGNSTADALSGAQAGQTTVNNNLFGGNEESQTKFAQEHAKDVMSCADAPSSESCGRGQAVNKAIAGALAGGGAASLTGEALAIWGLGAGANASIQYANDGKVNPVNSVIAGWVNVITMGQGWKGTVGWNAAGGALTNQINGDDPLTGAITNGAGAWLGLGVGNYIVKPAANAAGKWVTGGWDPKFDPNLLKYTEIKGQLGISKEMLPSKIPGGMGNVGGSFTSEIGSGLVQDKMDKMAGKK
ncbi:hemagglutinin repeat-containing protein [Erwinia aphidicola]|uniref:hemagglutinin repeat-containing protein n=1 Tax=Erwinia aphidicola TaxID=68334 RepID=UPI00300CCF9A